MTEADVSCVGQTGTPGFCLSEVKCAKRSGVADIADACTASTICCTGGETSSIFTKKGAAKLVAGLAAKAIGKSNWGKRAARRAARKAAQKILAKQNRLEGEAGISTTDREDPAAYTEADPNSRAGRGWIMKKNGGFPVWSKYNPPSSNPAKEV